jgi:helicase-like protein
MSDVYYPAKNPNPLNTVSGKPPVELYEFQKSYLRGLPAKHIFAADTGCFAKGTRVLMADMSYKNIEDVVAGDLVAVSDPRYWELRPGKVEFQQRTSNKPKPMIQFTYGKDNWDKTTITATYDHPFWDGERYYPLYEFVWRDMAFSQRVQLQLLCEQYGAHFDYAPSRGLSHRDNPTRSEQIWSPYNGNEWRNGESPSSGFRDMVTKPRKPAVHQPQGLQPSQQSSGQSGMGNTETEQPTRVQKRTIEQILESRAISQDETLRRNDIRRLGVVGQSHRQHAYDRLAYQTKTIFGIKPSVHRNPAFGSKDYSAEAVKIQSVVVKKAEPYYALGIAGYSHTYVVETLPVHNTGKTYMSLAHYDKHAYLKPLLILAPASKVNTGDWERELKQYFAGRILPEYNIYSYEKFSRLPSVKKYRLTGEQGIAKQWIASHPLGDYAVIADEVHKAKNPQSGIGKRVFEVSQQAAFFCGLSATPLPNGWIDAANYFKIFGHAKNVTEFKKRYCNIQTYKGFPEIVDYYHQDDLQAKWNRIAKPLKKDQALDLPPLTFVPVTLHSGKDYIQIQKDRIFGGKFLDNPSALMHALRQSLIEPKVKWLDDFLEEVSDNVVVFYNYQSERDAILKMIKQKHKVRQVFRQDGEKHEVPSKDKWSGLRRTITLAQYQSGSTGIELTYAATTVYFSPTYSYSNYEQSIGRTNRNGQTRKMSLYLLCAPTTLEKDVWSALRNKTDFQTTQWLKEKIEASEIKESAVY